MIEAYLLMEILFLERGVSRLESTINKKFSELKDENVIMKTQTFERRNSIYGTFNKVNNITKDHDKCLEQLSREKEIIDEKSCNTVTAKLRSKQDYTFTGQY